MQNQPLIAPSVLAMDFSRLGEIVKECTQAGVDRFHFDIMDGHFVPNISFGASVLASVRSYSSLPMDVHLMVTNPDQWIAPFVESGCQSIATHIESTPHIHRTLQNIKKAGISAGVAINPGTSVDLLNSIIAMVDYVLIMTVNPGFGGQTLIPGTLSKIDEVQDRWNKPVYVDGGIKKSNVNLVKKAQCLVVGTGLYEGASIRETVQEIKTTCTSKC